MDSTTSQLLFITAGALLVVSLVAIVVALRGRPVSTLPVLWPPTFFHPLPEDAALLIAPSSPVVADRPHDSDKTRVNEITRPLNADPFRTNEVQQLAPEADITKPNAITNVIPTMPPTAPPTAPLAVLPNEPSPPAPPQDDADATGKIRIDA